MSKRYYEECRARFPPLRALVYRGPLEDMVPGISDIDMRLICDEVAPGQWAELDEAVYNVHASMVREGPQVWRLLEHPPGACVTTVELCHPHFFHPEMRQWQWGWGDEELRQRWQAYLAASSWSGRDERYYLRRLLSYYGPWQEVEPRINVGERLPQYRLHGIVMLHFLPALQAALSLIEKRGVPGKLAALRGWLRRQPDNPLLSEIARLLACDFEEGTLDDGQARASLQKRCRAFLDEIAGQVLAAITLLPPGSRDIAAPCAHELRLQAGKLQSDSILALFDAVRFSRIRRSHFRFFLNAPADYEADFFIANEIATLGNLLTATAFAAYAQLRWGMKEAGVDYVLTHLQPPLGKVEEDAVRRLFQIAASKPGPEEARPLLAEAAGLYPRYHLVLEQLLASVHDEM
ncbi:MAG: hypothetical protein ACUVWR_07790 [Anaerolineae bacterium]